MTWNYRMVERLGVITIHTAFYKTKKSKKPHSIGATAILPLADSVNGMKHDLALMLKATKLPVLKYSDY